LYLKNLHLTNFRSYEKLDLEITPGINIFVGKNGEGKTNIVEAIIYLTFLNSHRVANVQPLIKLGQETAYIRSKVSYPNRELEIVLELNAQKPNKATVNQNPVKSQKELFGLLQSIYFSPEDLDLVRGDSSLRRRFLDEFEIGFTLFGPHRDDLLLKLEDQPVKTYASHGESWSIALALKLSLFQNIKKSGASPILILDDVFAELDDERRDHLLKIMEDVEQTLITCAVENDIPKSISGKKYYVRTGFVSSYEV